MRRLPPIVGRVPGRDFVRVPPELVRGLRDHASADAETYDDAKPVAQLILAILASFSEGPAQ